MSTLKLEDLPDEIMLKIFLNLEIVDLINCGQLSKRITTIRNDSSLWRKINLCSQKVPTGFLQLIKNNGCRYLSLCYAQLKASISLYQACQLNYLNLDMCKANDGVLEDLLYSCHYLQKLSLAGLTLNSKMIKYVSLQNGHTLEVLDLQCTKGKRTFEFEYSKNSNG